MTFAHEIQHFVQWAGCLLFMPLEYFSVSASHAGKVYRRRSTRLAATLLADGAPCFAICACPALVIKRDCSYIWIHFSLEIAEISLPIASSGKSSGDSK